MDKDQSTFLKKDGNLNDNIGNPCCDYDELNKNYVDSLVTKIQEEKLDMLERRIEDLKKELISLKIKLMT